MHIWRLASIKFLAKPVDGWVGGLGGVDGVGGWMDGWVERQIGKELKN